MENCPFCKELKDLLVEDGIKFTEVDINLPENEKESEKVFKITGVDSVPIVRVGTKLLAPDVSFTSIIECFELIKGLLKV
jgi:glutaredoxin